MHGAEVSDLEQQLGGKSYTLRTLQWLKQEHPQTRLRLLIGADVLAEIEFAGKLDRTAVIVLADHGMQRFAIAEPFDLAGALRDAGIDAILNDDQYVYLR